MSPIIQPNTSQQTDFEASEPNTYRAKIVEVEVVTSKEPNKKTGTHTPGIQPTFEFEAPRKADHEVRTVTRRAWLATAGKGTFGFDQLLRCTGNNEAADGMKNNPGSVAFDTDVLLNKYVDVVVSNTTYNNKLQDQIDSFLPPSGS